MDLNQVVSHYLTKEKLSASEEDYLEMIFRLCEERQYTRVNDIAKSLQVKPPSVSSMLKRLMNKGLISHHDYGTIHLTDDGSLVGGYLLERHNTVERFLKLLDIQSNFYDETEKIEHTLSIETLSKIRLLIEYYDSHPNQLADIKLFL